MSENKYCLTTDGAGVGTLYQNTCPKPVPGGPVPFQYIIGPAATDPNAVPMCAATDPTTQVQSFTAGACAAGTNGFTFYTYKSLSGQVQLCLMPPPTGIQGTVVTTQPNKLGACTFLNVKYQPVTCNELGCGDHGTCNNGVCTCQDNWRGSQCEIPPSNAGCLPDTPTQKSCGNLGSYGTCEASSTTANGITGSGQCACDPLTSQQGTFCEQACSPGDATACGGPMRGFCVDGNYNYFTNSNAVKNRCVCVNGWTGAGCTVPPPGWKCNNTDTLCTNITMAPENVKDTVLTGTCNNGVCACDNFLDCSSENNQTSAFTGTACQLPLATAGAPCQHDPDCKGQGQTCVGGQCSCGPTGQPTINVLEAVLKGLVKNMFSLEGLAKLAAFAQIQQRIPNLLKWMTTKALEKGFEASIEVRLAEAAAGKTLGADALETLEKAVGKTLASKVLLKMTTKEVLEATTASVAKKTAEIAFKEVFGIFGKIDTFANWIQIIGMVLDATDVLGLNEESHQSQVDATILKMNGAVNNNKTVIQNGLYFPVKTYADESFSFIQQTLTSASRNQLAIDAGNYINHLNSNSNGVAIIPKFTTPMQQQKAQLVSEAQGSVLYTLAGNNIDVYQRLKQDWPIIVAGILVAIGVLVGSAFGIKALVAKKKVGKQ